MVDLGKIVAHHQLGVCPAFLECGGVVLGL
jgi:hypothetical protein